MITLYSGTPGSGKSLHLIKVILNNLKLGRDVICNFPIKFNDKEKLKGYEDKFFYILNENFTINSLLEHAIDRGYFDKKKESQCMCIYDEAGGKYNTRDFNSKDRMEWIDFFSQHRKCGFDFILVSQSDRMIDRQIRTLFETEKEHRKLNNFGPFAFLPFKYFVAIERWYVAKEKVDVEYFRFKKDIGNRYDSMKMFDGFKLSPELLKKVKFREYYYNIKSSLSLFTPEEVFQRLPDDIKLELKLDLSDIEKFCSQYAEFSKPLSVVFSGNEGLI